MKKIKSLIPLAVVIIAVFGINILYAYQVPKEYTFKFTDSQVNDLWECLAKSEAPFPMVSGLRESIQRQYNMQIQKDSTGKDSTRHDNKK